MTHPEDTTTAGPLALSLHEVLGPTRDCKHGQLARSCDRCEDAEEIAHLRAEVAELDALRDKLAGILSRTAVALRGPEPPLTRWSWHDLPERAAAAIASIALVQVAERDLLRAKVEDVRDANAAAQVDDTTCLLTPLQDRAWLALLAALGPNVEGEAPTTAPRKDDDEQEQPAG